MSVEEDYKDVNKMVSAAKYGIWDDVYTILEKKPYLVNMIPEKRSWAALHQAVWWDNEDAVRRLLGCIPLVPAKQDREEKWLNSCDPLVLTKQDREGHGAGRTPEYLARVLEHPGIEDILRNFTKKQRQERFGTDAPYYVRAKDGERMDKKGLPLLLLALANYKQTFHPDTVRPHEGFHQIVKEIAAFEHNGNNWMDAKKKIISSMKGFCMKKSIDINTDAQSEDKFYEIIVKLYTEDEGHLYKYVNLALRRESASEEVKDYKPEGDELAIAPYALMLDVVLFCWEGLQIFREFSYRGFGLSSSDVQDKYWKGLRFVWLQFVSSSQDESVAKNFGRWGADGAGSTHYALFKIDNSTESFWQPRDITKKSAIPDEKEALYPAGAEFEVQEIVEKNDVHPYTYTMIKLKLIDPLAN